MKAYLCFLILISGQVMAGPTKVGNPDDGSDLEGGKPIESGPIVQSRDAAVKLLKKLNVDGIRGLGTLIPECQNSQLIMADQDVDASREDTEGVIHTSLNGKVYARTFAQPHAATRFFPISSTLNQEQLKALHIHEALHRALPEDVREDEFKVMKITLAITTAGATHDHVRSLMHQIVPPESTSSIPNGPPLEMNAAPERYDNPSNVGYSYRSFMATEDDPLLLSISGIHTIHSHLYPFGGKKVPLGFGIQASMIQFQDKVEPGPLSLSARFKFWTARQFDFSCWIEGNFNLVGSGDFENSSFDRDNISTGISIEKNTGLVFVENTLGVTAPSSAKQTIGPATYRYDFGYGLLARIKAGVTKWGFRVGAFGEINFSNQFKVDGGPTSQFEKGRYHILSVGPVISWGMKHFSLGVDGRFIVQSRKNADFTHLGNVLGQGAGQGYIGGFVVVYL